MFIVRAMCGVSTCSLQISRKLTGSFEWSWTICECGNEETLNHERITPYTSLVLHYSLFMHNKLHHNWRGYYYKGVRPSQLPINPRLELLPSWNIIHDTFPTGTVQDTTA